MEKTFEASLKELESIVAQLEAGDLPLEKSLELFEKGVKISRECRERLNNAERRIEILIKDSDGNMSMQALDTEKPPESQAKAQKRIVFDSDEDDENSPPF